MATVSPSQPWTYTLELPHDPRSPGVARLALRAVLDSHGMGEIAETATLLASELVTNAYVHTKGPCSLRLRGRQGERVRVTVWDTSPVLPSERRGGADREDGRGLWLVRECADDWGNSTCHREGKSLWFELMCPVGKPACRECAALGAAQRRAVDEGCRRRAVDATDAVRRHVRDVHRVPADADTDGEW
ncbi:MULTISPECIES: ATP-binding protein [Streptomyces]|uniref:ATP-binding protein n=1 Tax=Streptomyces TaxID=1883 RepID=UPI000D1A87F2|nr:MULTISPECIES: ATP-binding protein [Streptomyces]